MNQDKAQKFKYSFDGLVSLTNTSTNSLLSDMILDSNRLLNGYTSLSLHDYLVLEVKPYITINVLTSTLTQAGLTYVFSIDDTVCSFLNNQQTTAIAAIGQLGAPFLITAVSYTPITFVGKTIQITPISTLTDFFATAIGFNFSDDGSTPVVLSAGSAQLTLDLTEHVIL